MNSATTFPTTAPASGTGAVRAGWAMTGLVVFFLGVDGAMKVALLPIVAESSGQLGWPTDPGTIFLLGGLLLGATLLYALPRTAVLGAILLTGYLGGAVATHVRIGSPLFSHVLFGVYVGILAWGGLWLRDKRVRALLPLRR